MGSYYDRLNRLNANQSSLSQSRNRSLNMDDNSNSTPTPPPTSASESVKQSAFKASNISTLQQIPANTTVKVLYPNIHFDLANEFNSAASMFIPQTPGIYSLIAGVLFSPINFNDMHRGRINIQVNGKEVAANNDFFGANLDIKNIISVATIAQLKGEDIVEVFFSSSIAGTIHLLSSITRFEGAKLPPLVT
ncbi:hypothetical protein [Bacillus sp. C1]